MGRSATNAGTHAGRSIPVDLLLMQVPGAGTCSLKVNEHLALCFIVLHFGVCSIGISVLCFVHCYTYLQGAGTCAGYLH